MTCPKCDSAIQEPSNFCPYCGNDLRDRRSYRTLIVSVAACAIILTAAILYFFPSESTFDRRNAGDDIKSKTPDVFPGPAIGQQPAVQPPLKTRQEQIALPKGVALIYDVAGNLINKHPAAAVGDGWLALPADVCTGGYTWQFIRGGGDVFEIAGGIIGEQDEMGIWQLNYGHMVRGPRFSAWNPGKAMNWTSIVSELAVTDVSVGLASSQRYVIKITTPSVPDEAGVFTQGSLVVGWTFSGRPNTGFLWNGLAGEDLVYDMSVYDFYRATFENSREEQFILALAQTDAEPSSQLSAFADAFLLTAKYVDADTPRHLRPENIIARMRSLIARLIDNGQFAEAANAFDGRRLAAAGDSALVIDVVGATLTSYGFEAAVDLIEAVQSELAGETSESQPQQLDTARRELYGKWIATVISDGDIQTAWQIYNRADGALPQDPRIRLLGVELALASGDWLLAQRLLALQAYPAALSDRVAFLKSQIAAAKGEEGKITVRFVPGSRQIPVQAVLGGRMKQNFVIDTGATMVTIPRSTAENLGLSDEQPSQRKQVQTAGGIVDAYEVVLPSVQLGGSQIENVRALVLDLPNQPDTGLLGMNFLSRFRVNINADIGELTLAPR